MFSKKPTEGKRKHKEDNFDSFSYRRLDDLICSDKENVKAFDNIEDFVDNVLAKSKVTSYERHVKDIKRIWPFDKKRSAKRPKSYGGVGPVFGMSDLVSVKKLFSIVLSFVLLFAVLASASSFVDLDLDGTSVNPEDMLVEDTLSSNATIPNTDHTDDTVDDGPHFDNSTLSSDQNGTVTADNENMINETGDIIDNDTLVGENESLNISNLLDNQTSDITEGGDASLNDTSQQVNVLDNTTGYDNVSINVTTNESIDVSTIDEKQSAYATCLNITLNTDKDSYLVNEMVFISGTVVFNNSFVETTVNLSMNFSGNSFLHTINTTNGAFSYEYVASKSGNYIVGAHAIFENETASINTLFIVNDITDETDDVTVLSLIQGEAVVDESVFWEKKIMVKNNASIQRTLNIVTTIPDAVSNIKIQDVSEGNEVNYTVLVNQIVENNVSEQISSSTSVMFNRTFDAWGEREFIITYETPAPIKQEISYDGGKRIEIQSNATVHYSNVTAYTDLPELSYKPRFYRVINGTRVDVTFDPLYNVTYLDNNSNGKYDGISWNIPRLSNDTYEIDITIIDVQSYPVVGGNWTVRFTTTGTANLTIRAVNETAFDVDLEFLELRCGDNILTTELTDGVIFVENYSCDEIGYEISKVLTAGEHTLEFRFGDDVEYAYNSAETWLYVDGYTPVTTDWTLSGGAVSPYLDTQDQPTSYGYASSSRDEWEEFTFTDLTGTPTITSVNVSVYSDCGTEELDVYIYDSGVAGYTNAGTLAGAGWAWRAIDISTILTTDTEIDNAKVKFQAIKSGAQFTGTVDVDCARLGVVYEAAVVPTLPTVVTNVNTGIEETNATLRGYLQSNGSADTYTYFLWDNDASGEPYANNNSNGLTANLSEFQYDATSLTSGDLYYYTTKANNIVGWDNSGGELTFFTKPEQPDSITESTTTNTTVTFSVDLADVGSGATSYTYVRYNTGSAPTTRAEGTFGFNSTSASPQITGLDPGTKYNVTAWAWGEEGGKGQYSDSYLTTSFWTNPGDSTSVTVTNGTDWINVTFTHGTNGSHTMVRRNATGSADFPADRTSGVEVDNTTNTYANDTGLLAMGVTYYYALWTWDTDGEKWCDYQINITGITWNLSINAIPSQWNLGNVEIEGSNTSAGYYFNITNEGNATLNIQIKASNATNSSTGARWNLTSTPDHNDFTLHYDKSGDGGWTIINTTYDVFVTNLAIDGYQTFDLKMTHATTSSVFDPMSLDVIFKSVVS